jgi:pilus assembly protein CpaC
VVKVKNIFIALLLIFISSIANAADELSLFIGEIKILEVGAIDRIAVGQGDLLSTSILDNGQLLILAEKNGETIVHIWYSDGAESDIKIQILTVDTHRIITELEALLADLPRVEVKEVGQKIFLTGTLNCIAGQEECAEENVVTTVLAAYGGVINLTRAIYLQPPTILPANKMVSMDVKITEFNTSTLSELGINWDSIIVGPSAALAHVFVGSDVLVPLLFSADSPNPTGDSTFASPSGTVGIGTDISSVINLFVNNGDALILAEPRLSARSGGSAEFLAGGEVPVVTSSLAGTNVEYKEFGILLKINPVVDDENSIMASISTEVSAIDASISTDEAPGFLTRKTTTEVNMADGDTLILSGLVSRDIGESVDKFPILGDLPIIGALFRSTDWRNRLSELVIFVTPTVYDAKSEYNQKNVQHRRDLIDRFSENVELDKKTFVDRGDLILD